MLECTLRLIAGYAVLPVDEVDGAVNLIRAAVMVPHTLLLCRPDLTYEGTCGHLIMLQAIDPIPGRHSPDVPRRQVLRLHLGETV